MHFIEFELQRFLRSFSGTNRPGWFYYVFDTHVVLNNPKRYDILKILIKIVLDQHTHTRILKRSKLFIKLHQLYFKML